MRAINGDASGVIEPTPGSKQNITYSRTIAKVIAAPMQIGVELHIRSPLRSPLPNIVTQEQSIIREGVTLA